MQNICILFLIMLKLFCKLIKEVKSFNYTCSLKYFYFYSRSLFKPNKNSEKTMFETWTLNTKIKTKKWMNKL